MILAKQPTLILSISLSITLLSLTFLSSSIVFADDVVDEVNITVPVSCTMSGTGMNTHTAEINNGQSNSSIGETTIKAFCNDSNGFAIYAIGYTDNTEGKNVLTSSTLGDTYDIATGTATGPANNTDTSQWAMKLSTITSPTPTFPIIIAGSSDDTDKQQGDPDYSTFQEVPDDYTLVAKRTSGTDINPSGQSTAEGSTLKTTYQAYISKTQPAGTYTGQVKYTLVHPNDAAAPYIPHEIACEPGKICYYPNANDTEGTMGMQERERLKDWSQCAYTDNETYCYDSNYQTIDISTLPESDGYNDLVLLASNFSRTGYGFAGWSDTYDYATNTNAHFYGPNETIDRTEDIVNNGLSLYAVWIESEGSLQDSSKVATLCGTGTGSLTVAPINGTANLSSVSALTDQRDNQTYAIAKLADGKCWMIENLRLESEDSIGEENISLAQGYGNGFNGLSSPSTSGYGATAYNNSATQNRAINPTTNSSAMYSYGNIYGWKAATAQLSFNIGTDYVDTSICPNGWRLPYGNTTGYGAMSGSFSQLDIYLGGTGNTISNYDSSEEIKSASGRWRNFPNNYLLYPGITTSYWTSAAYGSYGTDFAQTLNASGTSFSPGNNIWNLESDIPVRCVSIYQP